MVYAWIEQQPLQLISIELGIQRLVHSTTRANRRRRHRQSTELYVIYTWKIEMNELSAK